VPQSVICRMALSCVAGVIDELMWRGPTIHPWKENFMHVETH
jgi:hypothetical protein